MNRLATATLSAVSLCLLATTVALPVNRGNWTASGPPSPGGVRVSRDHNSTLLARTGSNTVRFAVIGDYGLAGSNELAVANLVKSWNPDFVITVGDNNYPSGAVSTIDENIGQYYHDYISPYYGAYGTGAATNRFFASLGNHDWYTTDAAPYLDYFSLPGNERYYDLVWGPVRLFAIDSDSNEPDGITSSSTQATWLQQSLTASTACWNMVYFHHAPYSSGPHGSNTSLQWPFQAWGADAVFSGHDHDYERIILGDLPYFVNGLGGDSIYNFGIPVAGSQVRYNGGYGAMLVTVTEPRITYEFIGADAVLVDIYTRIGGCPDRWIYLPLISK